MFYLQCTTIGNDFRLYDLLTFLKLIINIIKNKLYLKNIQIKLLVEFIMFIKKLRDTF